MRLTFFGAAQEVTGSLLHIETSAGSLVVDCGMVQGRRAEASARNRKLPAAAVHADAALLTHAHIDHSGSLPTLVKAGFKGPIYATPATADLCDYMLRDSARIQEADAAYLNRKWQDDPTWKPLMPLYDEGDVIKTLARMRPTPYHESFTPLAGVSATFFEAGHILGSAQLVLDVEDDGVLRRLLITGDLGRSGLPILKDPETPPGPIDYLVMESTYGDRNHGTVAQMHDDLARVVSETTSRGGRVIIPAFAVGRTQELLYVLHELFKARRLPKIPIYVDSPLAISITEAFRRHPDCFDAETQAFLREHGDVFAFDGVHFTQSREASMAINQVEGPAIIISASGMAEAGRILHHLRRHVEDPRNTVLIVGFMAQHTLGRRLAERRDRVKLWGVERDLRARVVVLDAFSAHAGQRDLLAHVSACKPSRRIFLVHGEAGAQDTLAALLRTQGHTVTVPARAESIDLGTE